MARLVEALGAAWIVDAAAGRDGGFVGGSVSVGSWADGECLGERGLGAADGPAHVGADFGQFVAEKGDVWRSSEDGRGESSEEEDDDC